MSDMTDTSLSESADIPPVTIRIDAALADKIAAASVATKLKRSPMLRLAIDRGLDRLLEQLEVTTAETTNTGAEA